MAAVALLASAISGAPLLAYQPAEIEPLVTEMNGLLERNTANLEKAAATSPTSLTASRRRWLRCSSAWSGSKVRARPT